MLTKEELEKLMPTSRLALKEPLTVIVTKESARVYGLDSGAYGCKVTIADRMPKCG